MEREFRKELNRTNLVVKADESEGNLYETKMFLSCHVRGLLPCSLRHVDNEALFSYDTASKISLSALCGEHELREDELKWILAGILRTPAEMEDYLLSADHLCLDPEMIFLDREKKETFLLFVPFYGRDFRISLREMTEFLLTGIDREDSAAVVLGYRFYRMVLEKDAGIGTMLAFLTGERTADKAEEMPAAEEFGIGGDSGEEEAFGPEEPETAYGRRKTVRPEGKGGWRAKIKMDRRSLFLVGGGLLAVCLIYAVLHLRILEEFDASVLFGAAVIAAAGGALLAVRLKKKVKAPAGNAGAGR
jgi:hypothetical protein